MLRFALPLFAFASPLSAQVALIQQGDYPIEAIRKGEEGTVRVKLRVSAEGLVTNCSILQSASPSLDATTCRIITERARYIPASDDAGNAIEADVEQAIRWELGELKKKKDPRDSRGLRLED